MQQIVPFVDHEIGFRLLQKLIEYSDSNRFKIPVVVTTKENGKLWWPGVQDICAKAQIPLKIYDSSFSTEPLIQQADWFLLLSWKHLIKNDLISIPQKGVLNLHCSLLPAYRGVYPSNWPIIYGESKTGFTYYFVNEKIDDGEIFMQVEVPVNLSDTSRTLQLRMNDVVFNHFDHFIEKLLAYDSNLRVMTMNKIPEIKSEYYSRAKFEKICHIDLKKTYYGEDIFNLLRGLSFFEDSKNAYVIDEKTGKKIFINLTLSEE